MKQYKQLCKEILKNGEKRLDRTGTGTKAIFGYQFKHDMRKGFPLLTTKHLNFDNILDEFLWFINADSYSLWANELKTDIWKPWADEDGYLGPVYGCQWRAWPKYGKDIDQWRELIEGLIADPTSRRHIMATWNVSELGDMRLPPCHGLVIQCYSSEERDPVTGQRYLDLQMYQRSADVFLGVPWNIASYGIMLSTLAWATSHAPRNLVISFGDVHIYQNHIEQVKTQIKRRPKRLPKLLLHSNMDPLKPTEDDYKLIGYESHEAIRGEISV